MKLNLGSENKILEGWENLDLRDIKGVINYDLNQLPYPYGDNSIDEVLMSHIIEHLKDPISVLNELHRICKNKAIIKIYAPHFSSLTAYSDLDHKRPGISYFTFGVEWTNKEINKKFKTVKKRLNFTRTNFTWTNRIMNPLINRFPMIYERFFCWILPCSEVEVILEVIKQERI